VKGEWIGVGGATTKANAAPATHRAPLMVQRPSLAFSEPPAHEIHCWTVQLCAADDVLDVFKSLLSPDEADRERRFRFARHQRAFSVSRGALRILLSQYLSTPAADVRFTYGERGKPRLVDATPDLQFNCSHSDEIAVFSIARGCELGIDVEKIRSPQDIEAIAHRYFCPEEASDLLSVPAAERARAFFRCWTRKEAFIKAVGGGFAIPLDSFRVSLKIGDPVEVVHIGGDSAAANAWKLHEIVPAEGYVCALAYRDSERAVRAHPLLNASELLNWS
jgi:4'-phosphopantetheinyl transferase